MGQYQRFNIYLDVYIRLIHHQDGTNEPRFRFAHIRQQNGTWLTLYGSTKERLLHVDFHIEDEKHVPDKTNVYHEFRLANLVRSGEVDL